jgi:hypothetical protein
MYDIDDYSPTIVVIVAEETDEVNSDTLDEILELLNTNPWDEQYERLISGNYDYA